MAKLIDLTGQVFGRLTVLERAENSKDGKARWLCQCKCGKTTVVRGGYLRAAHTTSCGCRKKEIATKLAATRNKTDGRSKERLYNIWHNMKQRCNVSNAANYARYGGCGIKVCEEWEKDYLAFRTWALENGYADDLSIDRIDNDKGYSPENCRWISSKAQANNRRSNRHITFNGETLTLTEWAERIGLPLSTLQRRINVGWPIERALAKQRKK